MTKRPTGKTANDRPYALAASVLSSGRKYCVPLNYVTLIGVEAFSATPENSYRRRLLFTFSRNHAV